MEVCKEDAYCLMNALNALVLELSWFLVHVLVSPLPLCARCSKYGHGSSTSIIQD